MKPFPFFRLSQEVRDQIYNELEIKSVWVSVIVPPRASDIKSGDKTSVAIKFMVKVSPMPVTNFALVSRTFKYEYETELRRHLRLNMGSVSKRPFWPESLTEYDSRVRRLLRGVLEAEARIWHLGGASHDAEAYCRVRELLLPLLPNVKSFTQDLLFQLPATAFDPDDKPVGLLDTTFLDQRLPLPDQARKIPLKTRVYLTSALVSINPNYRPTADDIREFSILEFENPEAIRSCIKIFPRTTLFFELRRRRRMVEWFGDWIWCLRRVRRCMIGEYP
ncbi:hypothetical protein M409DRAFT_27661 [Zasmidium cellare ATCC 36951]|uniref:Uncharacterized protein n=1 Tax=Zasmidium cellare ATCC 36951 TaxID=1080233 RepID=A0A6A6C4I5_ZASCE|nr:uncharacterized protein M409DRAFT_27661 [Zasmidium cellare ATCC 36951]KAF2161935.1 hypothetical protein M409DRAFT_27661 [Zasmidium cellare ATCC 36951]